MKKSLFAIVVFLLLGLSVQAQVQRNFWGLELGRSTRADVKIFLNSRGLEYDDNFGGRNAIGVTDLQELSFGGYTWGVNFEFYNNILFHVQMLRTNVGLSMTTAETYNIDTNNIFYELRGKLLNKYGNLEIVKADLSEPHLVVRDNNTVVQLIFTKDNAVVLQYADRSLARKNINGDDL